MTAFLRFVILLFFVITILVLFLEAEGVLDIFCENFFHTNNTRIFIQIAESTLLSVPIIILLFIIGSGLSNDNSKQ